MQLSDAEQDLDVEKTPLESWEDGAAFGVAAEKDWLVTPKDQ